MYREMYEDEGQLLRFMSDCNIPIPRQLKVTAEVTLNGLLRQALAAPELDQSAIQALLEETRIAGIPLDQDGLEIVLRRNLEQGAGRFFEEPSNLELLTKFHENLAQALTLPFPLVLWSIQNRCYEVLQKIDPPEQFRQLATLLSLSITEPRP
jgi:hypothetical protein